MLFRSRPATAGPQIETGCAEERASGLDVDDLRAGRVQLGAVIPRDVAVDVERDRTARRHRIDSNRSRSDGAIDGYRLVSGRALSHDTVRNIGRNRAGSDVNRAAG